MRSITTIKNLTGKTVLLRADFNVPIENGNVRDAYRIDKTLATIKLLKKRGGRIIIISHAGEDGTQSLAPIAKYLHKKLPVRFIPEVIPKELKLKTGEVVLLENVRREQGEKNNDSTFAKKLSHLADIYVNDAFAVSHRKHASIVGVPKFLPSFTGLQLEQEIKHLSIVLKKPRRPFLFVLGGAKFSTKLPLIEKFLKIADHVAVTGALTNNFFKEAGFEVGISLMEKKDFGLKKLLLHPKLLLPVDVVVTGRDGGALTKSIAEVGKQDSIMDIGAQSTRELALLVSRAKLVLWNGPTGNYENGFDKGTVSLLKLLAKSKAVTIIGGGDTVALVSKLKLEKKMTFVSTGGGATLEFLLKGTLPGIQALK